MPRRPATLTGLRDALRRFAAARDWQQFHTPKNLAMALAVEAAELLEHFQWLTPAQSARLDAKRKRAARRVHITYIRSVWRRWFDVIDHPIFHWTRGGGQIQSKLLLQHGN